MQAVGRSEEFKASDLFLFFLCMPNNDAWQTSVKRLEKVKSVGPDLASLVTEKGKVRVN